MTSRSSHARLSTLLLTLLAAAACHPLGCCTPGDFPKDKPLELASQSSDAPAAAVDVVLDELGVPHIYGNSEPDLAYALGFLHGRDRQFQVYVFLHAAEGRLTELLGEDLLEVDRQNRLLTFGADEQLAAINDRGRAVTNAYADGLNDGARHTGRTAEMVILGVEWELVDAKDVLAITRLQQWGQSVGFDEEMTRYRLAKALGGTDDPRYRELVQDTPSGGVPIVDDATHSGDAFTGGTAPARAHRAPQRAKSPAALSPSERERRRVVETALSGLKIDVRERFGKGGFGASNSWAVDGAHNSSGVPVLCNDPHLGHSAPGIFYMVHMEGPDFTIAGGSFPGVPAVLIGHGRHVAWGITNAYADVQDVVVLRPFNGNLDLYELDGAPMGYTREKQQFKLGKDADSTVIEEDYLASVFGPVLPPRYGDNGVEAWIDDDERLALQWTAFNFPEKTGNLVTSFWDLAKARTIEEAHAALQDFIAPSMSFAIAISASDAGPAGIYYRLGGITPIRGGADSGAFSVDFPHVGATRDAGFTGILDSRQKPQLDNPASGFLVAANQRIVENNVQSQRFVGFEGAQPWRAMRIHERLTDLVADGGTPDPEALFAIQQDITSKEAQLLAPVLGRHCPERVDGFDDDVVDRFCDAVKDFDGVYSVDSTAVPFARLNRKVREEILLRHMSRTMMEDSIDFTSVSMAMTDLLVRADAGERVASFNIDDAVAAGAKEALKTLRDETGLSNDDWRWGKSHQLKLKGVLASAPVVGGLFETASREESGVSNAPRAENANPFQKLAVNFGAGLRHFAIMKETPEVRMVNDSGQSGHFGHRHLEDQYPLWTAGKPYVIVRDREDVTATNDGLLRLLPKE